MPSTVRLRRHFLPWDRPWLPQAVQWLAGEWDGAGPLDLSRTMAVVPTRQSGRRLREALAVYAASKGSAVFAPRVLTPDALVTQDPGSDIASRLESLLAWTEVFREIELDAFRAVFPVDPPLRNFPWALRLAQEFMRLQSTLAEGEHTLSGVAKALDADFIELDRWQQIAALDQLQAERLAALGLREPQAARVAPAHRPAPPEYERVVMLAVPDPQPLTLAYLSSIASACPVDVVIFAPQESAADFDDWGRPRAMAWANRPLAFSPFEERVHLCADPAAQAARLAALGQQYPLDAGVLALGLADPEVAPLLENELRRHGRPVFNPEGRALRHEGFFELLGSLASVAREPSFAAAAALGRCPDFITYLKDGYGDEFSAARWLSGLDALRARHLPADLAAARAFAPGHPRFPEVAFGLEAMQHVATVLKMGPFAGATTQALREIYGGRHVRRARAEDAQWEETAAAWTAGLREYAAAAEKFGELAPADAWELTLRLFGEQRRAEEKLPGALELQGWLELLWEDAPHVAVAGLNDGRVPEAVVEDPFLPPSLREKLGLQTNAGRLARDAYMLQAIAACRAEHGRLDLLFGKTSAAGDPLRPSRLLLGCTDAELPRRIDFLFRPPESTEPAAAWTRAWKLTPRSAPAPTRVAVTALRRYLSCPFRFYLRHVLRMESVDPLKSELDAFDFGTLCHAALEQIGVNPHLRDCTDADLLRRELLDQLDAAVRQRYGKLLSLPQIVQVESARQRLGRLAELQAAERAAGWEIIHVERPFELEISGLMVRGKIDRIDRHAGSGAVRVLDYKTSDTPVAPPDAHLRLVRPGESVPEWASLALDGRNRTWVDLQLPLYLRVLALEFSGRLTGGYFNLPKAAGETVLSLWDDYTPEIHESAMRCADGACAAIRRGEFWPPNETIRADRDECAALFHHGVGESVEWSGPAAVTQNLLPDADRASAPA